MTSQTYKTTGIVLKKTKLGEKDLIVTILDESGALVRAVAKGARKPGGSYAARLEVFSIVDLMLAKGKNLDVVTSARFSNGGQPSVLGIEQSACCSALAELLAIIAQENLQNERLFAMSRAAFEAISLSSESTSLALACSSILKTLAYAGLRPSFAGCVSCGKGVILEHASRTIPFSISEGGVVCGDCDRPSDAVGISQDTLSWADALMRARFEEVANFDASSAPLFEILHLVRQWCRVHVGKNLKSVDFLLSSGLF